jgi:hypothetical protein
VAFGICWVSSFICSRLWPEWITCGHSGFGATVLATGVAKMWQIGNPQRTMRGIIAFTVLATIALVLTRIHMYPKTPVEPFATEMSAEPEVSEPRLAIPPRYAVGSAK